VPEGLESIVAAIPIACIEESDGFIQPRVGQQPLFLRVQG
jgi:hypothetical protein